MDKNLFIDGHMLLIELENYESQGVSIWLEGALSSSGEVSDALAIHEESSYMRDYVFDKGRLSEIHFDKVYSSIRKRKIKRT